MSRLVHPTEKMIEPTFLETLQSFIVVFAAHPAKKALYRRPFGGRASDAVRLPCARLWASRSSSFPAMSIAFCGEEDYLVILRWRLICVYGFQVSHLVFLFCLRLQCLLLSTSI